jgi:hypothetical protein
LKQGVGSEWDAMIGGVAPRLTVHGSSSDAAAVSLIASPTGAVVVRGPDGEVRTVRIDDAATTPAVQHAIAFRDRGSAGCSLVWLELPMPFGPSATR